MYLSHFGSRNVKIKVCPSACSCSLLALGRTRKVPQHAGQELSAWDWARLLKEEHTTFILWLFNGLNFSFFCVSAETLLHAGQRDHDASGLLCLPVQRQQQVSNKLCSQSHPGRCGTLGFHPLLLLLLFHRLVEEFMLLANMATAHHIYRKYPEIALLRLHPPPKAKMVDELQELCDQLGIDVDLSSAGALHVRIPVSNIAQNTHLNFYAFSILKPDHTSCDTFYRLWSFPTCRRASTPLLGMISTPLPGKRSWPTCAPGPCRLEHDRHPFPPQRLKPDTSEAESGCDYCSISIYCAPLLVPRWRCTSALVLWRTRSFSSTTPSTFPSTLTSRHPSDATLTSSSTGCWLPHWVRMVSSSASSRQIHTCWQQPCRSLSDLFVVSHRFPASNHLFSVCLGSYTECGPSLGLPKDQVQKQAAHCNDKKTLSKRVQELSSELFFGVFVKVRSGNLNMLYDNFVLWPLKCVFTSNAAVVFKIVSR